MVQRAPINRYEQSLSFARETATIIDVIKRHFLVTAPEGTKEKAENAQKRMVMHVPKQKTSRSSSIDCIRVPDVLVEFFCGYLILRFFLNRKNSQNIV